MAGSSFVLDCPEELNRLVVLLSEHGRSGLRPITIKEMAASSTHGAALPDHAQVIEFALLLALVTTHKGRVLLTPGGKTFLKLNQNSTYELTKAQTLLLVDLLIANARCRKVMKRVLEKGYPAFRRGIFAFPRHSEELSNDEIQMIALLRRLSFLVFTSDQVEVGEGFQHVALALFAPRKMSLAELEELLSQRKAQGFEAEEWVLAYERKRLCDAGCEIEAAAVNIISRHDVTAGYDIESFDGPSSELIPNRLIEVKSTLSEEKIFFISENELVTARREKEKYWIYHLRRFSNPGPELSTLCDPVELARDGKISLQPNTYRARFD